MGVHKEIEELRDSYELHQCEWAERCLNNIEKELKELQCIANKYDRLVEKIKERIKSVEKCYNKLIKPYFDRSINMINTSYMSKKEKEEFINKRNCLLVQKATFEEILELMKEE